MLDFLDQDFLRAHGGKVSRPVWSSKAATFLRIRKGRLALVLRWRGRRSWFSGARKRKLRLPFGPAFQPRTTRIRALPRRAAFRPLQRPGGHGRNYWPAGFQTVKRRKRRAPARLQSGAVCGCAPRTSLRLFAERKSLQHWTASWDCEPGSLAGQQSPHCGGAASIRSAEFIPQPRGMSK